jgi:hypothetical protein
VIYFDGSSTQKRFDIRCAVLYRQDCWGHNDEWFEVVFIS